jgi:PKHD-type hydroxylase
MKASQARTSRIGKFRPTTVNLKGGDHLHLDWVVCSKRLSDTTCDELIRLGRSFPREEPTVVGQDVLKEHRVGHVHMMPSVPETLSLYQMLWDTAVDATTKHYGLMLSDITRMPHYVEYPAGRGHFHWHNDYSHEQLESPRKLTVIIQLTSGDEYEGGDLEVFGTPNSVLPRERGTVVCFPSFIPHRVTQVTAGMRQVIVAWIAGPRIN